MTKTTRAAGSPDEPVAEAPATPAEPDPARSRPTKGGSYIRQPDGSLKRKN